MALADVEVDFAQDPLNNLLGSDHAEEVHGHQFWHLAHVVLQHVHRLVNQALFLHCPYLAQDLQVGLDDHWDGNYHYQLLDEVELRKSVLLFSFLFVPFDKGLGKEPLPLSLKVHP